MALLTANTQASSPNQKQPTTVGELLVRFSNEKRASETPEKAQNEIEMVEAALRRTLIPALGGPEPMGSRSTPKEVEAADRFLFTIPLEKFRNAEDLQEGHFENTAANREFRCRHRCALNKLLNWIKDKGWLGEQFLAELQSSSSKKKAVPYSKYRLSDRTSAETFTLGKVEETGDGIEIILRDLNLQDAEGKPVPTKGLSLSASQGVTARLKGKTSHRQRGPEA